ncbi:integral membrane protein [Colletotrichum tofieldiae]|uniref:Integral membrane protein n=1 Tax=Colletotrichum tofieldiae TaxID=708197 RepID=A0A166W4U6_9PEZI|nr:integral membrane protein [Colletotrichum tofieldiae]
MYLLYKTITRATIPLVPILSPDADAFGDVDNHSIGAVIIASVVPLTIISTLFAFARLFVKGWIQRRIQYDDGILLLAVASGWTATGTTLKAVALGHGKHVAILTDEQKEETLRWTVMAFAFGIIALALPKLTIVALINRLLNPKRLHRFFLWTLVLLCAVGLLGNVIGLFAQCPQEAVVHISFTKTACLGPERAVAYSISTSAISAATNGYLAVYVALSVRRLKITRRKRLALAISLVLGLFLEADVVVIAACIPALQPLVDHHFPGHFSTPVSSPRIPASRTSTGSRNKIWSGIHDMEAGRSFSLSTQVPEMIMVEKEFEIAYSRTSITRSCTSDTWISDMPPEERLQIVKDHAPDGSITTVVVVKSSTRPPNHPAFPTN